MDERTLAIDRQVTQRRRILVIPCQCTAVEIVVVRGPEDEDSSTRPSGYRSVCGLPLQAGERVSPRDSHGIDSDSTIRIGGRLARVSVARMPARCPSVVKTASPSRFGAGWNGERRTVR